jgi:hypothetical protein
LIAAVSLRADIVPDIHSAQVAVADQSSGALARGSRAALAEVLVKVSGSVNVLQNPVIKSALKDSRRHVQKYAYIRGSSPTESLSARFEFDSAFVSGLIRQAGVPLWTANRPLVLAWVVVEDQDGRHFLSGDAAPEQAKTLMAEFARRGVPVQLPLFDLQDTATVSLEDAWRFDAPSLQAASARYKVEDIVVARLSTSSTSETQGDWHYLRGDDRVNRSITAPDLQSFLRQGVGIVAGNMAARYAVAPMQTEAGGVLLSVTGVFSYADYAGIVHWLESLELIEYANIVKVQGDRLDLQLAAQTDAAHLATIIELNERFVPASDTQPTTQLSYRWQN